MIEALHIEIAPFRVADGVTESELVAASDGLQTALLESMPGFIARMLLRKTPRDWTDLVFWRSREDAQRAMQAASSSPACARYFSLMCLADHDDPDAGVEHLDEVRRYAAAGAMHFLHAAGAGG